MRSKPKFRASAATLWPTETVTLTPPPAEDPAGSVRELLAEGRFQEALKAFGQLEGQPVPPDIQLMAATAATRLGDLDLGSALAGAALERFRNRADDDGRMRSSNLLGVIAFERGHLDQAQQFFTIGLGIARALKDSLMTARISNNLASLADLRGNVRDALTLYRSALLSYQRLGDRRGTAESYHNLGITFRQMGEWDDAESSAAQAVRHAEAVGERSLMGIAVMGRAEIDLYRDELAMARQELGWAGRLAQEAGDEMGLAEMKRLTALVELKSGHYEEAANAAESARLEAINMNAAVLQAECAAASAFAFKALGRAELAGERRAEAVRLFELQGAQRRLIDFKEAWAE